MTEKKKEEQRNVKDLSLDELKIAAFDVNAKIQNDTAVLNAILARIQELESE